MLAVASAQYVYNTGYYGAAAYPSYAGYGGYGYSAYPGYASYGYGAAYPGYYLKK